MDSPCRRGGAIEICFLGKPCVKDDGEKREDLGADRPLQLLALLPFRKGEVVPRHLALENLWERKEGEPPPGENDLNPVVSRLDDLLERLNIDDLSLPGDGSLRLDPPSDLEIDFLRVEAEIERLEASEAIDEHWEMARGVIDGLADEMMRGGRSTPFLEQRRSVHADIRYRAQLAAARAAQRFDDAPRRAAAKRDAERAIEHYPHEEAPRLELIQLHLGDGSLAKAEVEIDSLAARLNGEAPVLSKLLETLEKRRWRQGVGPMPLLLTVDEDEEEAEFVGHEEDLETLEAALRRVLAGAFAGIALAGDKGMGKSRLARELGRAAHRRGCAVIGTSALRRTAQEDVPCGPFIDAVKAWIDYFGHEALGEGRAEDLAEISLYEPDLAPRAETAQIDKGLGAEGRLRRALLRVLAEMASLTPTILLLDDAQEADDQTLLLLDELKRRRPEGLMLVATCPDDFSRKLPFRSLRVLPLPPPEAKALASAIRSDSPPDLDDPDSEYEESGIPFLIVNQTEPNRILSDFVLPQIEAIEPAGLKVLRLAAVLGSPFELKVLQAATEEDVTGVLSVCEPTKLVRPAREAGAFEFSHSLIREAILGSLSEIARSELSLRLVSALGAEPESARARQRLLKEVVTVRPDHLDQAAGAAYEAGEHAAGLPNYEAASKRYAEGLELVDSADPALRGRLLVGLGHSLWSLGEFGAARERFLEALAILGLPPAVRAEAALGFGGRLGFAGAKTDRAYIGMLRYALAELPPQNRDLRLRLRAALAGALTFSAETPEERRERSELCAETLAGAETARDPGLAAELLSDVCWTSWDPDQPQSRRDLAERFVAVADESLDVSVRIEARIFRIASFLEDGEMGAAWQDLSGCEELAKRSGQPHFEALVALLHGMKALLVGNPEEAGRHTNFALECGGQEKNPAIFELYGAQILLVRLLQGRVDMIRAAAEAMASAFPGLPGLRAGLGLIYAELGRTDDAQRQLDQLAHDDFAHLPRDVFWLITMEHAARLAVALGDRPRCVELRRQLTPYAGRIAVAGGAVAVYGAIDRALGLLAIGCGDRPAAIVHLREAMAINERIGATAINAFVKRELADALETDGDSAERERLLGESASAVAAGGLMLSPTPDALAWSEPSSPPGRLGGLKQRGAEGFSHWLRRLIEGRSDEWIESKPLFSRLMRRFMSQAFVPAAACGWTGSIELQFEPPIGFRSRNPYWAFEIARDQARIYNKRAIRADLRLVMSPATFFKLVAGIVNPVEAWLDGDAAIVEGDPTVAARLIEMFSGPAALPALDAGELDADEKTP